MRNIILLTHGEFSKGIAQSCGFILGEVENLRPLSITLDETIDQIRAMVEAEIEAFGSGGPTILVTDIPGGSTTQAAVKVMAERQDVYLVTGLNLGLLVALIMLEITGDREKDLEQIRLVVNQAKETITLVNDMTAEAAADEDGEL